MRRILVAAVGIVLVAAGASAEPAMWTVRGARSTAVLFGSVHLLPKGVEWQPARFRDAIAKADEIWFELPIDGATEIEVQKLAAGKGLLPTGDSLFDHLSTAEQARLKTTSLGLGLPPEFLARMRPWMADVTLSMAADMRAGALASEGVEQQVAAEAPPATPRRAFETVRQQIALLADPPQAEQVRSLDETVAEIADDPGIYDRVLKEWLAGDLTALSRDALEPVARTSPEMYRRLLTARNRRWAAILNQELQGDHRIVVVVGAAHLIGPGGVPALLKAQGFAVEGPDSH